MSYSLKNFLQNSNVSRRLAYIAIEPSAFDIPFKPCLAIKRQVIVYFIVDWVKEWIIQVEKTSWSTSGGKVAGSLYGWSK